MWQSRTPYDESLHLRNQIKHGSWLLSLKIAARNQPAKPLNTLP